MRILLVGLNYLPEATSIGPYTADLAAHFMRRGHEVTVSTGFPNAPQWKVWDGYEGRWWMKETINGVPVKRSYLYVPKQPKKALQRILFDSSFALSALIGNLFSPRADLVIVVSPPLQIGVTGWLLGLLNRAPCFLHIQDLVPDAAVAVGALRQGSWPVRLAHAMERFIYRRMAGIGVIAHGFRTNLVRKGVPEEKIEILPNYIDTSYIQDGPPANEFRSAHGIPADAFLVVYSGSVAAKQGLHTFVEAAAELQAEGQVRFCLIGEGPYLDELKGLAASLRLPNILFLPIQPRATLTQLLAEANALVVTQTRSVTDIVFPGKLLYYMAAGRPILAAVSAHSETGTFIAESQVGAVVHPEDPAALANAILQLKAEPDYAARLGANGRRVCLTRFGREDVLTRFTNHMENLVNEQNGGRLQVRPGQQHP
jgi:putative colanic acid biosynthesis glycosyltransferase WcaI